MSISSTMTLCYGALAEPDEASIRPTRDPPPGRAGDWADVMLLLARDRDRIAGGMNDLVVHRLFSAGLALEMALGLIGDHPGAGKVQERRRRAGPGDPGCQERRVRSPPA